MFRDDPLLKTIGYFYEISFYAIENCQLLVCTLTLCV